MSTESTAPGVWTTFAVHSGETTIADLLVGQAVKFSVLDSYARELEANLGPGPSDEDIREAVAARFAALRAAR